MATPHTFTCLGFSGFMKCKNKFETQNLCIILNITLNFGQNKMVQFIVYLFKPGFKWGAEPVLLDGHSKKHDMKYNQNPSIFQKAQQCGRSLDDTFPWVTLQGAKAPHYPLQKVPWKIYNVSLDLHGNTCKINRSQQNSNSLCSQTGAAERDETKGTMGKARVV